MLLRAPLVDGLEALTLFDNVKMVETPGVVVQMYKIHERVPIKAPKN